MNTNTQTDMTKSTLLGASPPGGGLRPQNRLENQHEAVGQDSVMRWAQKTLGGVLTPLPARTRGHDRLDVGVLLSYTYGSRALQLSLPPH